MSQYTFTDWALYVRQALRPEQQQKMQAMLQAGEAESVRLHALAQSVKEAVETAEANEVPEAVLQRARGIFQPIDKKSVFALPQLIAELVFDSLLMPQAAGLRTQGVAQRETVHRAGGIQVSLRVEQEPGTHFMAVVGQLQEEDSQGQPAVPVASRPVLIFQKDQLVARTLSGGNGEFQMEFRGRYPLKLVVLLEDPARRIDLDLVPNAGEVSKRLPGERTL